MSRYLLIVLLAALTIMFNTGCKLIYKQNVQQGNAHEQEDLDKVELGMTKKQVAYLLGTPAVHDPFHQDRWDYISMFSRRGGDPVRRLITLTFEDDLLVMTDGIGDSTDGDIEALEDTKSAVTELDDIEVARESRLETDEGIIVWTLQLAAFGTHKEAAEFVADVRKAGYEARILQQVVPGLGTRHQVRSGEFDTFNEAQAELRRVEKDLDITGITVPVEEPD